MIIEKNKINSNLGSGIYLDSNNLGTVTVRYNNVYDNSEYGLYLQDADGSTNTELIAHNNLIHGNSQVGFYFDLEWDGTGLEFYNNSLYNIFK